MKNREPSRTLSDLRWLPDDSGFLYAVPDLASEFGNIYRYDMGTNVLRS